MMQSSTLRDNAQKPPFEYYWETIHELCLGKARYWHNHPRHHTPDDLAQIAAIKVWMAFDSYDETRPLKAFVNKIAFNAFVDACKSDEVVYEISYDELRPAKRVQEDTTVPSVGPANNEDVDANPAYSISSESSSLSLDLEPLLACLTHRQRQVIEKSFGIGAEWWEQTDDSIAEDLGVTRQTVISDRKKAIREMQIRVGIRTTRVMAA